MRGEKEVKIYTQEFQVKANIASIKSMSAHADYDDLCQFIACQKSSLVKSLFIVHGEYDVQEEFRNRLLKKGFKDIEIPNRHQIFNLD
jgi:metallo-beta-lactamase family protein